MAKEVIKLALPVYWTNEKKTKESTKHLVSQNWFRNIHFYVKNKVKKEYCRLVEKEMEKNIVKIEGQYTVSYKYYYKDTSSDAPNVIHQVEKFALDALVTLNILPEDNVKFLIGSGGWSVESDPDNPRVEIEINKA